MKTADEIKKGLECCSLSCIGKCPYGGVLDCSDRVTADALAIIQQLEAQNAEKDAGIKQLESGLLAQADVIATMGERIQQLETERDAAVKDLSECTASHCPYCKHWDKPGRAVVCINCRNGAPRCKQHFEWRGVQKEE